MGHVISNKNIVVHSKELHILHTTTQLAMFRSDPDLRQATIDYHLIESLSLA